MTYRTYHIFVFVLQFVDILCDILKIKKQLTGFHGMTSVGHMVLVPYLYTTRHSADDVVNIMMVAFISQEHSWYKI